MTAPEPATVDLRLVPAALTCWLVTATGLFWGPWAAATAVGVAGVAMAVIAHRTHAVRVSAVLAVVAVGIAFALTVALRLHALATHPLAALVGSTVWVTFAPTESPRPIAGGRLMFAATVHAVRDIESSGRVMVFAPATGYEQASAGRPMAVRARVGKPRRRDLSVAVLAAVGEPRWGTASTAQRAGARVRADFAEAARLTLPPDQAALLPGLVLGDTAGFSAEDTAEFRRSGLTHLTAVSGANVSIVCGAVLLSAMLVGPRAAVALAALALLAFVVVVQPSASVLRSAAMGSVMLLGILARRRRQAIPALAATVLALMVISPEMSVDVGFALSVSATAALVTFTPMWSQWLVTRGWPKPIADAVCVALAAHVVTAPLVAAISGQFSVIAVMANLLVAPVIPPITILGTAAAAVGCLWPGAAALLIRFTGPELWWLLKVAHGSAALPGAAIAVPSGWGGALVVGSVTIGAAVLPWLWRRLRCPTGMKRSTGE